MSTAATAENGPIEVERIPYPFWPTIVFLVLLGLLVAAVTTNRSNEASPESGIVMNLPSVVGNYLGISEDVSQAEKVILPPDTKFAKRLTPDTGTQSMPRSFSRDPKNEAFIARNIVFPGRGGGLNPPRSFRSS